MATEIWVNIGSGNGLLPDGTKPLPEPMLTDHQWGPETFILGQFHKRCLNHQSLKSVSKLHIWNVIQISQWVKFTKHLHAMWCCWQLWCYPYCAQDTLQPLISGMGVTKVLFPNFLINSSPLDKMATILAGNISIAFSWMKMIQFWFNFHCTMFPGVQLTISQHWLRYWLGAKQATSHYLNQWWPIPLTHTRH